MIPSLPRPSAAASCTAASTASWWQHHHPSKPLRHRGQQHGAPQLPAGCTVTYRAALLGPATTRWDSGHACRFLGVHLAEQRYRLEGERTLLGKQGRLGWIMSLQLCPFIWALILFLLYLLVFKVSLVASMVHGNVLPVHSQAVRRVAQLWPASECLAPVLAISPARLPGYRCQAGKGPLETCSRLMWMRCASGLLCPCLPAATGGPEPCCWPCESQDFCLRMVGVADIQRWPVHAVQDHHLQSWLPAGPWGKGCCPSKWCLQEQPEGQHQVRASGTCLRAACLCTSTVQAQSMKEVHIVLPGTPPSPVPVHLVPCMLAACWPRPLPRLAASEVVPGLQAGALLRHCQLCCRAQACAEAEQSAGGCRL